MKLPATFKILFLSILTGFGLATQVKAQQFSAFISPTHVTCFGLANGTAKAVMTNGVGPYRFKWSNGDTLLQVYNLNPGNFSVTVTDATGKTAVGNNVITQPEELLVNAQASNNFCFGSSQGCVNLTSTGGNPGAINVKWNINGSLTQSGYSNCNLPNGIYTSTLTDTKGCKVITSTEITSPPEITIDFSTVPPNCAEDQTGSITSIVQGGTNLFIYRWSNGGTGAGIGNLPKGKYILTVTDGNNCVKTDSITIAPLNPTMSVVITPTISDCVSGEGNIGAVVTGGASPYAYEWSNSGSTAKILEVPTGVYTLKVTDSKGCVNQSTVAMFVPAGNILTNDILCKGQTNGSIQYYPGPAGATGLKYKWSNGQTVKDLSNLAKGTYILTVTDASNCKATFSTQIKEPVAIKADFIAKNDGCSPAPTGSASVDNIVGGTAPFFAQWSDGSSGLTNPNGLNTGFYTVTVSDRNGCFITINGAVGQDLSPFLNLGQKALCGGDPVELDATNAFVSFKWSTAEASQKITVSSPGSYSVTATNADGCIARATANVNFATKPPLRLPKSPSPCLGSTLTLTGLPPNQFTNSWFNGSNQVQIKVVNSGFVSVTFTNNNTGCKTVDTCTVKFKVVNNIKLGADTGVCQNSFITLSPIGNNRDFKWNTGSTNNPLYVYSPGTYSVTCHDSQGCLGWDTVVVKPIPNPSAIFTINKPVLYSNEIFILKNKSTSTSTIVIDWGDGEQLTTTKIDTAFYHFFKSAGHKTIKAMAINACGTSIQTYDADVRLTGLPTGINKIALEKLKVYPNPASQQTFLKLPYDIATENINISVYNTLGQAENIEFKRIGDELVLDVRSLSSGIYRGRMEIENQKSISFVFEFIKE